MWFRYALECSGGLTSVGATADVEYSNRVCVSSRYSCARLRVVPIRGSGQAGIYWELLFISRYHVTKGYLNRRKPWQTV